MTDRLPEFEQADKKGSTVVYTGTVSTAWVAVPFSPTANDIQSISVEADVNNAITNTLSVSLDAGTTTVAILYPTGHYYQLVKGVGQYQVWIMGFAAGCAYRIIINYEDIV